MTTDSWEWGCLRQVSGASEILPQPWRCSTPWPPDVKGGHSTDLGGCIEAESHTSGTSLGVSGPQAFPGPLCYYSALFSPEPCAVPRTINNFPHQLDSSRLPAPILHSLRGLPRAQAPTGADLQSQPKLNKSKCDSRHTKCQVPF